MASKKRLDLVMQERMPERSRQQIQSWIMQGKVRIDGQTVTKAGTPVSPDMVIEVDAYEPPYVSRAGLKLEHALVHFGIDVTGFTVLDAGLSTGGFADCLLQRGARKIYGVDVGYGQVHEKIRSDPRVIVMERTNLRELQTVSEPVDLITLDLSFISILKVIPAVHALLKPGGMLITLIKPQFEAGRDDVGRGGIVRDSAVHERVIEQVKEGVCQQGFEYHGCIPSPILGTTGNKEFLAYFIRKP